MPDISSNASHEYWKQYYNPIIPRVLCWMESVETPLDHNTLLRVMLQELGKLLDRVEGTALTQPDTRAMLITLANRLNMAQTLRMLQAIDSARPGAAAQLLMYGEQTTRQSDDESGIFLQRNLVFERLRLLTRVFAEERLKLVSSALQQDD